MKKEFPLGLCYDDVLLEPRYSIIKSRKNVSLKTNLTKNIKINLPIVSANMDTVTESKMAIALAQMGGIGIIHRFMTIERQIETVKKVKRFTNYIVNNPFTLKPEQTINDYEQLALETGINGFPVIDKNGILIGIVTRRDTSFQNNKNKLIKEVMTPQSELITAKPGLSLQEASDLFAKYRIEKLPVVDKKNKLMGLIAAKDIKKTISFPNASRDKKGQLLVGAAIGVSGDFMERAEALIKNHTDILVLDIAHGHSQIAIEALKTLKKKYPKQEVIAGNVATPEGVRDLIKAGADAVKIGVGPGSACSTRVVAGAGVPQLSAVLNCAQEANKNGIPVIADGGIRFPADVVKALAAGATTVMLGNLLAGTDEAPGVIINKNGRRFKFYRGMASFGANVTRRAMDTNDDDLLYDNLMIEGAEGLVPYRGKVQEVVDYLLNGLRSGMSYNNAGTIKDLAKNAKFVRITENSLKESHPHDLEKA
jgi:IMP dehydrogenase